MIKCPICDYSGIDFLPYGSARRENAKCPRCGSLERHRLLWLYFQKHTNLFTANLRVLHFSPMTCFRARFSEMKNLDYNTVDIADGCDYQFDIQSIPDNVGKFDVVLAVHVLEHIDNDILAMREIRRILKPDGWAVLQVPINRDETKEAPLNIEDRTGQKDHVRGYGADYIGRLKEAGFDVKITHTDKFLSDAECELFNVTREDIYFCRPGKEG